MNKKCCKSFPHLMLCFLSHSLLLLTAFIMFSLARNEKNFEQMYFSLGIIFLSIFILFFIFTIISGWNSIVVFDDQKVSQKRWLKKIEWKWEEICDVTCRLPWPLSPSFAKYLPKIKLIHAYDKRIITFALWPALQKKILELCSNEVLREKLNNLINNFDYWPEIKQNK